MLAWMDADNVVRLDLIATGDTVWHRAEKHIHSFTKMFDPPERRMGISIRGEVNLSACCAGQEPFDGCIKLTGVWPDDAESALSPMGTNITRNVFFAPWMRVLLNGQEIWRGDLHMPIVCAGWPSIYWRIPPGLLREGKNELQLNTGENTFLLNQCSVFVRYGSGRVMEPIFVPRVLTTGSRFCVTMTFYRAIPHLEVDCDDSIRLVDLREVTEPGDYDFFFIAEEPSCGAKIRFRADDDCVSVDLPSVLDVPVGLPCYVGTDSDDHRHDDTGMMSELLLSLFRSGLGNLVMFRPKPGRNCLKAPNTEMCREWMGICKRFDAKYLLCNWSPPCDFPEEVYPELAADPNFIGCHAHEPYFMMFEPNCSDRVRRASDFQQRRDALVAELRAWADERHRLGVGAACGEASWLSPYDAAAGFDVINTEVVTGFGPQFGAVNGAIRGRPGMSSGSHIAVEWYLGYPYDDLKSLRFWIMALLSYTHGARYIYTENSLFFTNGYQRHDPEDRFTSENRSLMKQLYDLTKLQPRFGEICPELAIAYGNLEGMLWHYDDLLPEVDDTSDWAKLVWNKWSGEFYKPAMRAMDAWLPLVETERYNGNRTILKWFSGNPYGNVEMVSVERPQEILGQYKVLAFLGWNTMTEELTEKLNQYVSDGGTLFIAGCHFDRRLIPDGEYCIDTSLVESLLGLAVAGPGGVVGDVSWNGVEYPQTSGLRLCRLSVGSAEVLVSDSGGNPVLLRNRYGKGAVYFYNFWDHPSSQEILPLSKAILSMLGENAKDEFGLEDGYGINCSHWYDAKSDTHRLYLVNTNWQKPRTSQMCTVRLWGRHFPISLPDREICVITIRDGLAVIPDSHYVFVKEIAKHGDQYRVNLIGTGYHSIRFIRANEKTPAYSECGAVWSVSLNGDSECVVG